MQCNVRAHKLDHGVEEIRPTGENGDSENCTWNEGNRTNSPHKHHANRCYNPNNCVEMFSDCHKRYKELFIVKHDIEIYGKSLRVLVNWVTKSSR